MEIENKDLETNRENKIKPKGKKWRMNDFWKQMNDINENDN